MTLRTQSSQYVPWRGWHLIVPIGRGRGWKFVGVWKVLGGLPVLRPRYVRVHCSYRVGQLVRYLVLPSPDREGQGEQGANGHPPFLCHFGRW
jgi:hypothetical protein